MPGEVVAKMVEAWNAGDKATYMACASPEVKLDENQGGFGRSHDAAWPARRDQNPRRPYCNEYCNQAGTEGHERRRVELAHS